MASTIISLALRGCQALFAIIILGLSAGLLKGQVVKDQLPSTIPYAIFTGAFGLVCACIGVASNWVEILQTVLMAGIDCAVAFFYLAGGVIIAYKLRGINCAKSDFATRKKMTGNNLLNGGCEKAEGRTLCGYTENDDYTYRAGTLNARCKQSEADAAFMFMSVLLMAACVAMLFIQLKKK
ncbi:uncharacterized protein BDR25DRAFT_64444 [Lindgomyces ingoldianus]|uniref:Uncharacterized protein n=1 Tax=Lindgomyces ingoldianus TaxID=673940 RepID=A0ACB6RCL1_9PLEO|nr:uncharacterized protein BDR25DRAFT_64444 [Lindgomyces ingoldianus]KAF2476211.1 hypothetical protein BDR25DRAFT_64444 [Lindgomyces ingoldianus]